MEHESERISSVRGAGDTVADSHLRLSLLLSLSDAASDEIAAAVAASALD